MPRRVKIRFPTGHTSRWLRSRLDTAIPMAEYRTQMVRMHATITSHAMTVTDVTVARMIPRTTRAGSAGMMFENATPNRYRTLSCGDATKMSWRRSSIRKTAESERHQLPMFWVEKIMAPATWRGKYDGSEIRCKKYRKKNGCSSGTIAAAGLRQIQRHPMRPHAARTRPFCGCTAKLTSTAMSALPGHPPGPVDSEEEHGDGFHRQGGRREDRLVPGD